MSYRNKNLSTEQLNKLNDTNIYVVGATNPRRAMPAHQHIRAVIAALLTIAIVGTTGIAAAEPTVDVGPKVYGPDGEIYPNPVPDEHRGPFEIEPREPLEDEDHSGPFDVGDDFSRP